MVSLCGKPGSRRWTCTSTNPGTTCNPFRSTVRSAVPAAEASATKRPLSRSTSNTPSANFPSRNTCAFTYLVLIGTESKNHLSATPCAGKHQKNRATVPVTLLKPTMPPRRQTRSPTGSPAFGTQRSALCEVCDSSGLAIGYKGTTLRTNTQPFETKKSMFLRKTLPQADFPAVSAIIPCGCSLPNHVCGPARGEARPAEAYPPSHRLRSSAAINAGKAP